MCVSMSTGLKAPFGASHSNDIALPVSALTSTIDYCCMNLGQTLKNHCTSLSTLPLYGYMVH